MCAQQHMPAKSHKQKVYLFVSSKIVDHGLLVVAQYTLSLSESLRSEAEV